MASVTTTYQGLDDVKAKSMLFSESSGVDASGQRALEPLVEYYNRQSRSAFRDYRQIVNGFLSQLPNDAAVELVARMKSGDDLQYGAGLLELVVFRLLHGAGYEVEVHPNLPYTERRPDFLIRGRNVREAIVEVTTINPPQAEISNMKRQGQVYEAVNSANINPHFWLGFSVIREGEATPSLNKIRFDVESWTSELDPSELLDLKRKRFRYADWLIEIDVIATPEPRDGHGAIGISDGKVSWNSAPWDFTKAFLRKSYSYKDAEHPVVLAIGDQKDEMGSFGLDRVLIPSLLGKKIDPDDIWGTSANPRPYSGDGCWFGRGGSRHRHVSAVIALPFVDLWGIHAESRRPRLAINPWASHPIEPQFLHLDCYHEVSGKWSLSEGERVAKLLGISEAWPGDIWE